MIADASTSPIAVPPRSGRTRTRRPRRALLALLALLLCAAPLGGCALLGAGGGESPREAAQRREQDARIRAEVEARLAAEPAVDTGGLRVAVSRGEVRLHGRIAGFGALQCALANAELAADVRLVIDLMVLEEGPRDVRCLAPRIWRGPIVVSTEPDSVPPDTASSAGT